ncbi:Fe(3+) ABC transporter substrate-binding protein [Reinekea blandensis]|uniref:ABC-type Fe3+ transport system, periplasmic component n=1 Tax=Reinekea blandensis MED297 TaxID=314283 RepID=A4BFI4_9GAMM|nr:Fe(3+) ABC transporter substrate-binding protein [Reinekea blandensis]EAR09079.1 ABC-type Fe3+ transport system, periplasmic component [Reinekea sp. MED297] [Reinekea blandensis MED297]
MNFKQWVGALVLTSVGLTATAAEQVSVYSARKEALIKPLLDQFSEQTGIKVNLVTGSADTLLKRLELEGQYSKADVFVTVDAGRLYRAKMAEVLQPIESDVLEARVPANLQDADNFWFGLSQRARTVFYNKNTVADGEIQSYEQLADEQWRGRICVRSSDNIYNQSLVASLIEHNGIDATENWAEGVVANMARPPAGGDTDQLLALAAGLCDLTFVNTYYFGRLLTSDNERELAAAENIGLAWMNQDGRGVHMNVSGAGVTKAAPNRDNAILLLEFLVSDDAQSWYAHVNNEYPVVDTAEIPEHLAQYGSPKIDSLNLTVLGENNREAVELMDRAGWR